LLSPSQKASAPISQKPGAPSPFLSESTLNLLQSLRKDNQNCSSAKPEEDVSMKMKHAELLLPERELVLPLHYKALIETQGLLDASLNFMTQCRRQGGLFSELKKSIEQTYGK
jgi:hypothetical protein